MIFQVHLRAAKRLLKLCEDNGGAFIKVGQHLGALDYLIPLEYVRTLRVLHNHAPASKFEDIWSVIREDLQCEVTQNHLQMLLVFILMYAVWCLYFSHQQFSRILMNHPLVLPHLLKFTRPS